jgi:hypothetical protein
MRINGEQLLILKILFSVPESAIFSMGKTAQGFLFAAYSKYVADRKPRRTQAIGERAF